MKDRLLFALALAAAWQALHWIAGADVVPAPAATLSTLARIMADEDFPAEAMETLRAFLWALALSLAGGLALGVALGAWRFAGAVMEPVLSAFYAIPKITLYPVILLLFGLGIQARIAFGVIHGIVPVALIMMTAVRNVRPIHRRVAQSLGMSPWRTAWRVLLPATLPEVITASRLGFALTLLGTLIGEMFASQKGLGHMLMRAMETDDVPTLAAVALLLVVTATAASAAFLALEARIRS